MLFCDSLAQLCFYFYLFLHHITLLSSSDVFKYNVLTCNIFFKYQHVQQILNYIKHNKYTIPHQHPVML